MVYIETRKTGIASGSMIVRKAPIDIAVEEKLRLKKMFCGKQTTKRPLFFMSLTLFMFLKSGHDAASLVALCCCFSTHFFSSDPLRSRSLSRERVRGRDCKGSVDEREKERDFSEAD